MRRFALRRIAGTAVLVMFMHHAASALAQQVQVRPLDPVEVRQGSRWVPATILRAERPGWVRVQLERHHSPTVVLARHVRVPAATSLESADKNVAQERVEVTRETAVAWPRGPRTWADCTGSYYVNATLVSVSGRRIKLLRTDGHTITVALDQFSQGDQQLLRAVRLAPAFERIDSEDRSPNQSPVLAGRGAPRAEGR